MLGRSLVWLAIALSAYAGVAAVASARRRNSRWTVERPELLESARRALVGVAACLAIASGALWYALFTRDFSNAYVARSVGHATRPLYTFSAFWSGMDGSMLLWCLVLACVCAVFAWSRRPELEPLLPWAIPVLAASLLFYLAITAGPANPFRTLDVAPADGSGFNPLLQSPWVLIHPPTLYVGYVGLTVPFAVVVAALITGRTGVEWIRLVRRWMLVPWLGLGAGMVLGGAWAYEELGWGGYWGWDPVENAALFPWLAATAFLHSAVVQERRGMLKVWNVFLVVAAAALATFGTFLTRSGLIASVHTFTESPLGRWFFLFLATQTILGVALLAWRLPLLRSDHRLGSPVSREAGFLVNNLIFVGAGAAILWGTLLPIISEAATGRQMAVGPPFYNRIVAPIGAILMVLAAVGPLLPWRRGSVRSVASRLAVPAGVAGVFGLTVLLVTRHGAFAAVLALAALVAVVSVREIAGAARSRAKVTGEPRLRALTGLVQRNPRRYGGYVIHVGVAIMVVGFAGSLFNAQAEFRVDPGERFEFAGYAIDYREMVRGRAPGRDIRMAVIDVHRGDRLLTTLRPQQNLHDNFGQPRSEIAIRTTPREDLYVILAGTWSGTDTAVFRMYRNPLVFWVWAGALVAVAGGLVALFRERTRRSRDHATPSREVETTSTS